jgi:hypothetical protein
MNDEEKFCVLSSVQGAHEDLGHKITADQVDPYSSYLIRQKPLFKHLELSSAGF